MVNGASIVEQRAKNGKVPPQQHRKRMTSLKFKLIAAIPTMTKQQ